MKVLLAICIGLVATNCGIGGVVVKTPTQYSSPGTLTINSGSKLTVKPGGIIDLTGATIINAGAYEAPLTFSSPLTRTANTISIPLADGTHNGYLSSASYTNFNNKLSQTAADLLYQPLRPVLTGLAGINPTAEDGFFYRSAAGNYSLSTLTTYAHNFLSLATNVTTALTQLGLGTAATKNTGTTNGTIPLLNGAGQISVSMIPFNLNDGGGALAVHLDERFLTANDGLTVLVDFHDAAAVIFGKPARLKGYTVATLPAGTVGDTAYVTDASNAIEWSYLAPVTTGGGGQKIPVWYNGSQWVAH